MAPYISLCAAHIGPTWYTQSSIISKQLSSLHSKHNLEVPKAACCDHKPTDTLCSRAYGLTMSAPNWNRLPSPNYEIRSSIPRLGILSFKSGIYLLAWSLSQLEKRSTVPYLDWIVGPLYRRPRMRNKASKNQKKNIISCPQRKSPSPTPPQPQYKTLFPLSQLKLLARSYLTARDQAQSAN